MPDAAASRGYRSPRHFGRINWRGVWSLYRRDMKRYLSFVADSILGPILSSLLFIFVFVIAAGGADVLAGMEGVDLAAFIGTGLVGYQICLGAFQAAAFPVVYDKMEGMIQDVLSAPLMPLEMVCASALAATTASMVTASAILLVLWPFIELPLAAPHLALAFAALSGLFFALIGYITGLWAEKWDRYAAVETFLILPVGMLSGTFFAVGALPEFGQQIIRLNPVFYAIDGFRSGFLGPLQSSPAAGLALLALLDALLLTVAWSLVRRGYKIRP